MNLASLIREIGRGAHGSRDLAEVDAHVLYRAMLDGEVPDLELGAILIALRMKTESLSELCGFHVAAQELIAHLQAPAGAPRPIVIPTYNGARRQANLTPLLALALARFGVPVLVHGLVNGNGRVSSAEIFSRLGIQPCDSIEHVQRALETTRIAFAPTAVLCAGLDALLARRARLGVRNSAHSVAKLIDPFHGASVRLVSVSHPAYLEKMRAFLGATVVVAALSDANDVAENGGRALLSRGTEGEAYANPKRRRSIEYFDAAGSRNMFDMEETAPHQDLAQLPAAIDAEATAVWIGAALDGEAPLPSPLVDQIACCLFASGHSDDFEQAKAVAGASATRRRVAA